ncbi:MAG: tetratricopeptide repeat protein [Myxococcota bacterium]
MINKSILVILTLAVSGYFSGKAQANCSDKVIKKLKALHKMAMEDYDQMEFSSARRTLKDAISIARRSFCTDKVEYANILVDLGIMYITDPSSPDESRGRLMFKKALKVNACAKINPDLKTPRLQKILNQVSRQAGIKCASADSSSTSDSSSDSGSSATKTLAEDTGPEPDNLEHKTPDEAPAESSIMITCRAPKQGVDKVVVYYRKPGESDYSTLEMTNYSGYSWKANIPGKHVKGAILQYYIAALNSSGSPVMAHGNSGAPNIISLTKPEKKDSIDSEDPLSNKNKDDDSKSDKSDSDPLPPSFKKFKIRLGGRFGVGFLSTSMCSYKAEDVNNNCDGEGTNISTAGFATGEIGGELGIHYFVSENWTMGLDMKTGFVQTDYITDGNNMGVGFIGLGKALYHPMAQEEMFRFYIGPLLGGGLLWHQWVVDEDSQNEDIFKHGYVMIGGSLGFEIGSPKVAFYVNIDAMGVFPLQSTVHIDFTSGLSIGF